MRWWLLTLTACSPLKFGEIPGPIAVGARFDVAAVNYKSACGYTTSLFDCQTIGASITAISVEPSGIFVPDGGPGGLRATGPGVATIDATADLDGRTLHGTTTLEAADPVDITVLTDAGFPVTRFVMPRATTVALRWAATDASGRDLFGADFLAYDDPSAVVDVALADGHLAVTSPDSDVETDLVDVNGEAIAGVRVADAPDPDRGEVIVPDTVGTTISVRLVGWAGDETILAGGQRTSFESLTPDICAVAGDGVPLGGGVTGSIVSPGLCTVKGTIQLTDGKLLDAEGSGRVATPISRTQP